MSPLFSVRPDAVQRFQAVSEAAVFDHDEIEDFDDLVDFDDDPDPLAEDYLA